MSLIDFDSWINESDACERLAFDIQNQIGTLSNASSNELPHTHSRAQLSATIRIRLNQLSNELRLLNKKLDQLSKGNTITKDECERRQRQVENIQSKYIHLSRQFDSSNRTSIASSIIKPSSSKLWEDDDDDDEPALDLSGPSPSNQHLREDNKTIMARQNESLENLSKVISRQKNIALKISEEVEEQSEILDDIAIQMDRSNVRIGNETEVITTILKKDSTWGYWLTIICLFIGIIVVIFI